MSSNVMATLKRKHNTEEKDIKKLRTRYEYLDMDMDMDMDVESKNCGSNVTDCLDTIIDQCYAQSDDTEVQLIDDLDYETDRFDVHSVEDQLIGDHETQASEGGEADLHKHRKSCMKNPDHTQFIPVETFTIKHLPEGHRDNDLYELIKATADLTVRVDVKMISPQRPQFWPNKNKSYPFYNNGGITNLRTGSGKVNEVYKYTHGFNQYEIKHSKNYTKCWCTICQHSDSPSNVWWEFDVITATHVVFDEIEANHTSLKLFYDRDGSSVVILDKVTIGDVNIDDDVCKLKSVTCDKNLVDKLEIIFQQYVDGLEKVKNKYEKSRDVVKLNFIVSHPHGCSKQVTIGHWINQYQLKDKNSKFTYTTSTCPGSSGGAVHCVGYSSLWGLYQLVHSVSVSHGINCSGACHVY